MRQTRSAFLSHARKQVVSPSEHSVFAHDFLRPLHPQPRAFLGRRLPQSMAEDLRTDAIVITNLLERSEESAEIHDTLAWKQSFVVADLFRRQLRCVRRLYMYDSIAARGDDVLRGTTGVMPVPGIEEHADIRAALLSELDRLV